MEKLIIWLNLLFKSYNISFLGLFFIIEHQFVWDGGSTTKVLKKQNIPTVAIGNKNTTVENTIKGFVVVVGEHN